MLEAVKCEKVIVNCKKNCPVFIAKEQKKLLIYIGLFRCFALVEAGSFPYLARHAPLSGHDVWYPMKCRNPIVKHGGT